MKAPRTRIGRVAAAVAQTLLSTWFILPLIPIVVWALARSWPFPLVLPDEWGLTGFSEASRDGGVSAFAFSMLIGLATAALATPAGAMAAFALTFCEFHGRRLTALVLLAPVFVPPFVVVMGLNVVLLRLRVPSFAGIAVVLMVTAIPYTTFVMRSAFSGYDMGFEDEARTLGARPWIVLLRVRIPLLSRPLAASAFLAFLVGWSDYIITLLVGGGEIVSVPIRVAASASGTGNEAVVAALSVAAAVPPLLLLLILVSLSRSRRTSSGRVDSATARSRDLVEVRT